LKEKLIYKIQRKKAKIAVIGLGYVGLPTASVLAKAGFQVVGIDINPNIITGVNNGVSHTREPNLNELILELSKEGKLKATDNVLQALSQTDIIIVCVQTPVNKDRKPNLAYLKKACKSIAKSLKKGGFVIIQSTIPPKTMKNLVLPILESSGLTCGLDFGLAYCPERMSPGNGLDDLLTNARIIGGYDVKSAKITAELFKFLTKGQLQTTDLLSAEIAKLAENTFRDVNIAFANELALICEQEGADVKEVIKLTNTHPRVNVHNPGCGVGGPCLPKDPHFLLADAKKHTNHSVIKCSRDLNSSMEAHTFSMILGALSMVNKDVKGSRICILGVAYKGGTNDTRGAPSEFIIRKLLEMGAQVKVFDPLCSESFGGKKCLGLYESIANTDCLVILTDHKEFASINLRKVREMMSNPSCIVDGKRVINPTMAKSYGIIYYGIGFGKRPHLVREVI
jgi:UDP-N-acetyl-D-mannosaminuronic acid dehydrogenase